MAIQAFHDADTQDLFEGTRVAPRFVQIQGPARRKLELLDNAAVLSDLRMPPNNKFEALEGRKRRGQHSIRINDQYRVCFIWTEPGPTRVEIVDYHDERR